MNNRSRLHSKIALILIISALCMLIAAAADTEESYTKTAVTGDSVGLTKKDITQSIGSSKNLAAIRITALPAMGQGILKLEGTEVSLGDEIPLSQVSKLKFIPSSFEEMRSTISFVPVLKNGIGDQNVDVDINLVKGKNRPPEVTQSKLETFMGMPLMGHLNAYEPDGERLVYRVSEYPDKGDLEVNEKAGVFVYYPFENAIGKDKFVWYAFDENGNISKKTTVNIKINKIGKTLTFGDMTESTAQYQAISLVKKGVMDALKDDELYLFDPDREVTRAEFIVSAAKAVGAKIKGDITETPFGDDADIKEADKPYIWYSLRAGVVTGYPNGNSANVLKPDAPITANEAAVIVSRLLKMEDAVPSAGVASSLIPAWASRSVINLKMNGIMQDSDTETVSRETAAGILFESMRYNKENSQGLLSWAR